MSDLARAAIEQIIAGNIDNAYRHRLQGTEEDERKAARLDRQTAVLRNDLIEQRKAGL